MSAKIQQMEPIPGGKAAPVHVYVADGSVSFHVVSFARIAEGKIIQLDKYRGDDGPALEWRQKLGNRPQTAFVRQRQSLVRHFSLADDFIPAAHAFARSKRTGKKEQQTNRRYKHKPAKWLHSSLHFAGRNTVILFEAFGKLRQIGIAYSFGNFVNLVFLLQQ